MATEHMDGWGNGAVIVGNEFRFYLSDNREMASLQRWWLNTAAADLQAQMPKMLEYGGDLERQLREEAEEDELEGAIDLTIMGVVMAMLLRWRTAAREIAIELSIWFYTLGKIARLVSDYHRQRPGKADTWHDVTVYSMMARRVQEYGRWP